MIIICQMEKISLVFAVLNLDQMLFEPLLIFFQEGFQNLEIAGMHALDFISALTALTVMPSGMIMIRGETASKASAFHCYKVTGSELTKHRTLPWTCDHMIKTEILGLTVGNNEVLAVSCCKCLSINLLDVNTGKTSVAFRNHIYSPREMCSGQPREVFVHDCSSAIMHFDCSGEVFGLIRIVPTNSTNITALAYIPEHKLIVVGSGAGECAPGKICAISMDTLETSWMMQKNAGNKGFSPDIIAYCRASDNLFATVGHAFLAINGKNGAVRKLFRMPEKMGKVASLCVHGNQLIAHCVEGGLMRIIIFEVLVPQIS